MFDGILQDWRGRTPLHLAAMNGHYEMVSLLIAQGSNINVMDQVIFVSCIKKNLYFSGSKFLLLVC